jgi:SAM-dependent methyltransferase
MEVNRVDQRARLDLFLISLLLLFAELACIRWFPPHVLYLTFFTNTVLLACFLGMSLGCLAVKSPRDYLAATPYLFGLTLAAGLLVEREYPRLVQVISVTKDAREVVYFGAQEKDIQFALPIELIAALFFVLIALSMVGLGQELGRALDRLPNRVEAYSLNIFGSIVGIAVFGGFSWLALGPVWWFLLVALGIAYFLFFPSGSTPVRASWIAGAILVMVPVIASVTPAMFQAEATYERTWSPYYCIDYLKATQSIVVNQIGHQGMESRTEPDPVYALPYLLARDAGETPVKDILIIGAGSGNDVSRALQWAPPDAHIDAVEIDPMIRKLGEKHPDAPYQDPRVTTHINDGRNFMRASDKQYDLVIFALIDSLVLHSGYSNIRLESYLFTEQAFEDVKKCLKPGGRFLMYNAFREGWLVGRLKTTLDKVFGADRTLTLMLPYQAHVKPEDRRVSKALFITGNIEALEKAFWPKGTTEPPRDYWLRDDEAPSPASANGFEVKPEPGDQHWERFGLATVDVPEGLGMATDDWPFLYVRHRGIPMQPTASGIAVMGVLALIMVYCFLPRSQVPGTRRFDGRMFFLGAGFMLIETKAVVHMALLFGSTWMVNSVVFTAVLVMILIANLFVIKVGPKNLAPYYIGLLITLLVNASVPLDSFLGMGRTVQILGSCLLVMSPFFFAAVIFAVSFRHAEADHAFGMNIAGAMAGGLAENLSILLGFQHLVLVGAAFYVLSMFWTSRQAVDEKQASLSLPVSES